MSGTDTYKAFISYAHQDAAWANRLQRRLENFQLQSDSGKRRPLRPVFVDRSELSSSPNLSDSINEALQKSESLVVICSPAAAASQWVNAEVLYFKRLGKKTIYPFIVSGEPTSNLAGEACFPPALRYQLGDDGELTSTPEEPLAADARKSADGRDAILKLIAGLLHVPFDTLKLRQQRRRLQQALAVTAGATAMLVLTIYLAVTAITAQQDAERKRDQAEDLISFMLIDLRERLQPVGRLDVLDGVGEKALAYFSSLSEAELTGEAMLTRATALRQIGEVRVAQGRFREGLDAFNEALTLLSESYDDNETTRLFELGQVYFWIADAYFNDLQLERAQEYIEKYLNVSRELARMNPENADFQLELLYAESNLGTLAFRTNDLNSARQYFDNALTVGRKLAASLPGEDNDYELADTLSWIAAVEASAGNLGIAIKYYEEQISLRRSLLAREETPSRQHLLGRALWLLGDTYQQSGMLDEAASAIGEAVQIYRHLVSYDPQNFDWRRELAWSLTLLARDAYASGESADKSRATLALAEDAMAGTDQLDTTAAIRILAAIAIERARIELAEGAVEQASVLSTNATQLLTPLVSGADRIYLLPLYAKASYVLAEAAALRGDDAMARRISEQALLELGRRDDDHIELRAYGVLLTKLAQRPEAEKLLAGLAAGEYRAPACVPNTESEIWWNSALK